MLPNNVQGERNERTMSNDSQPKKICIRCFKKDDNYSKKRKQILNKMNGNLLINKKEKINYIPNL